MRTGPVLDAWLYREIVPGADILIITYGCDPAPFAELVVSAEHSAAGRFSLAELEALPMPEGYRHSIRIWAQDPRSTATPTI